ncbi:MAG: hypothetical protein K2P61_03830 [Burkholderiaceae bacterium]|nr:hypothetical protein [Burkholderiaceae bacterium]
MADFFCLPGADTMRVELIWSALFVDSLMPAIDQVSANTIKRYVGFYGKKTNCLYFGGQLSFKNEN